MNEPFLPLILVPCYLPPIAWFALAKSAEEIILIDQIRYEKQTLMSRTHIKGANKIETLSVPVERSSGKGLLKEARICYRQTWYQQHRQAIQSAYGKSAFFEYLADDIFMLLSSKPEYLWDLNLSFIHYFFDFLEFSKQKRVETTTTMDVDVRKLYYREVDDWSFFHGKSYFQPFGAFVPNLSILDAVFHMGKDTITYLNAVRS